MHVCLLIYIIKKPEKHTLNIFRKNDLPGVCLPSEFITYLQHQTAEGCKWVALFLIQGTTVLTSLIIEQMTLCAFQFRKVSCHTVTA